MKYRFMTLKEHCSKCGIEAEINEDDIMTFKNVLTSSEFSVVYNAELDDYVILNADHASASDIVFIITMLGAPNTDNKRKEYKAKIWNHT